MPIRFRCEKCSQGLTISTRKQGTSIVCPKCNQETRVPAVSVPGLDQQPQGPENPSSKIQVAEIKSPDPAPTPKVNGRSLERATDSILDIDFDLMMSNEAVIDTTQGEGPRVIKEKFSLQKFLGQQTDGKLFLMALAYTITIASISSYITYVVSNFAKITP